MFLDLSVFAKSEDSTIASLNRLDVDSLCYKYVSLGYGEWEVRDAAMDAISEAIRKYSPAKDSTLRAYATKCIHNALRSLRRVSLSNRKTIRRNYGKDQSYTIHQYDKECDCEDNENLVAVYGKSDSTCDMTPMHRLSYLMNPVVWGTLLRAAFPQTNNNTFRAYAHNNICYTILMAKYSSDMSIEEIGALTNLSTKNQICYYIQQGITKLKEFLGSVKGKKLFKKLLRKRMKETGVFLTDEELDRFNIAL